MNWIPLIQPFFGARGIISAKTYKPSPQTYIGMKAEHEIELEGHIIDSGIMTRVFDKIMDMGGNFEIIEFNVGKRKTDPSYARLRVISESEGALQTILSELYRLGARDIEVEDVVLTPAEGDRIVPRGFYSTTNHPTFIKFEGQWIPVEDIKMDSIIVVDRTERRAFCRTLAKIRKGDLIVTGERGIRVAPPERPREQSTFEFMHGTVSPERPSESLIAKIAAEIVELKRRGGRIALVGGPAIIHTGAAAAVAEIVRKGYIDVIFAGNALAVHDIEYSMLGTSLGMDISTGLPVSGGHRNHILAISEVMRAGSIRAAVERGLVKSGIMYECVKRGTPFVLAGSIRDDGPIPDVTTDVIQAQDQIRMHLRGCEMVLMVASLLHSIAVGNCLPSYVKTICVDINPSAVTKLMDRGTMQAIGIVSDAGTFFPLLAKHLEAQSRRLSV